MKLPIAYSLKNRASTLDTDAKLVNAYVETRGDPKKGGIIYAEKRPAMDSAFELPTGTGQGLFVPTSPDGDLPPQVIIGDIWTWNPTAKAKRLAFGVQPTAPALNTAISPSITVRILNSLGALVSSATNDVTIALFDNDTGATLGGTLTRAAVGGVATFNDITLNRSGSNFTIQATATGLNSVVSNPFTISTQFAFTTQPSNVQPNTDFTVAVTARDSAGNTDTAFDGSVTLSLYSATGNAVPTGDFIVDAVAGVATFANISMSDSGISGNANGTYSFIVRADSVAFPDFYIPAAAVSNSFTVAEFTHDLTAATTTDATFSYTGFIQSMGLGSISPTTLSGVTIKLIDTHYELVDPSVRYTSVLLNTSLPQGFFTSITNTLNGRTLNSADATYIDLGGETIWTWTGAVASNADMFDTDGQNLITFA